MASFSYSFIFVHLKDRFSDNMLFLTVFQSSDLFLKSVVSNQSLGHGTLITNFFRFLYVHLSCLSPKTNKHFGYRGTFNLNQLPVVRICVHVLSAILSSQIYTHLYLFYYIFSTFINWEIWPWLSKRWIALSTR